MAKRSEGWNPIRVGIGRAAGVVPSASASTRSVAGHAVTKLNPHHVAEVEKSDLLDPDWYCTTYPDVAGCGLSAAEHYLAIGAALGRDPSPMFDTSFYLHQNPGVARHRMNPLLHYMWHGRKEGRSALPPPGWREPALLTAGAEEERLPRPDRRPCDGRTLLSMAQNHENFWYRGPEVEAYLHSAAEGPQLPAVLRRLLVIGHEFRLTTGVARPVCHYLNALLARGGLELTSIELAPGATAEVLRNDLPRHDFVLVNSIAPLKDHPGLLEAIRDLGPHRAAIYLHETAWAFDRFAETAERYGAFVQAAPELNFLCVSRQQAELMRVRFGARSTHVVHNATLVFDAEPVVPEASVLLPPGELRIVMAGTVQRRKGVDLFSRVADLAAQRGLPFRFEWAGHEVEGEEVYRSPHVQFHGALGGPDLAAFLVDSQLFFLPSLDDPFPLACLEALLAYRRVVCGTTTGFAEIAEELPGCAVFAEHTPEAALEAIERAACTPLDIARYRAANDRFSLRSFVFRMNAAIAAIMDGATPRHSLPAATPATEPRIAAILHLYYLNLWPELRAHLGHLAHRRFDLYVTLSEDAPAEALAAAEASIRATHPAATILRCPNRGMDIGPFVSVVRHIAATGIDYDLVLKIHTKKSLAASGAEAGRTWRRALLNGLLAHPAAVEDILSLFVREPGIGMIGPRGMLMSLSSHDAAAGANRNLPAMADLGVRLGVEDLSLRFFRGSMFWARAATLFAPILAADLTIDEFEPSHLVDGGRAHAMERLFGCLVRGAGQSLHEFDPDAPFGVDMLRDRHRGQDVWIILSGPSCDHIDPAFFRNKVTIGVNRVISRYDTDYVVMKEWPGEDFVQLIAERGRIAVVSKWDSGNIKQGRRRKNIDWFRGPNFYYFDHLENLRDKVDVSVITPESSRLVVSYSTVTSAIHLAALMGAANIILVGHDCGLLDGRSGFGNYNFDITRTPWKSMEEYTAWLGQIEGQTLQVRDRVREAFGCAVHSLNPFINFGLEGHVYTRA